ncbi:MAG: redoxin domain-containing protein [Phycisphaera sp.]|nr:redoxin domain-containing protein [Phycisphaera sp.]
MNANIPIQLSKLFSASSALSAAKTAAVVWMCGAVICLVGCVGQPEPVARDARGQPLDASAMEEAASSRSKVIGRMAPDFTLPDDNGQMRSLRDFRGRGWLVLYFYPADDTPGCTCQATEFTSLLYYFHNLDASVVGISSDAPNAHAHFRKQYALEIELLSDTDHKVMSQYGAFVDTTIAGLHEQRVIRSTFLIDPGGKIAWHWPEVIPKGHAQRVAEKLEALKAQR